MAKKIVVVGGNIGGLTVALELKRKMKDEVEVTLVNPTQTFTFTPSMIWVIYGRRKPSQASFSMRPALEKANVKFIMGKATKIDPEAKKVHVDTGDILPYDFVVIATGPKLYWDAVPGLGPEGGFTHSVCTLPHTLSAYKAWQAFLKDPGPIVVGGVQGASCLGAAYEVVLNLEYAARKAGVRDKVDVTFITPEPFLSHFGIGGIGKGAIKMVEKFFQKRGIKWIINAEVEEITQEAIVMKDGRVLPQKYTVLIPPFKGVDFLLQSPDIADANGFIPTRDDYRHVKYEDIYAAGIAVAAAPPEETPVPMGVPKTGFPTETMARVVVDNIIADIKGEPHKEFPLAKMPAPCVLDAGRGEIIIFVQHFLPPHGFSLVIPDPTGSLAKIIFEKYYQWKMRTGRAWLP